MPDFIESDLGSDWINEIDWDLTISLILEYTVIA